MKKTEKKAEYPSTDSFRIFMEFRDVLRRNQDCQAGEAIIAMAFLTAKLLAGPDPEHPLDIETQIKEFNDMVRLAAEGGRFLL